MTQSLSGSTIAQTALKTPVYTKEEPTPIYVFADIETTGLNLVKHGIIQIGAYATGENPDDFYGYFVEDADPFVDENYDPTGIEWEQQALDTNKFTLDRIKAAEPLSHVLARFCGFIARLSAGQNVLTNAVECAEPRKVHLVFHNAKYDAPRIELALERAHLTLSEFRRVLCTVSLGYASTGKVMNLDSLAAHYGIKNRMAHDGLADAITTSKVFHAIKKEQNARKALSPFLSTLGAMSTLGIGSTLVN